MALTILARTSIHRHVSRLRDRARHSPSCSRPWHCPPLVPSILQTLAGIAASFALSPIAADTTYRCFITVITSPRMYVVHVMRERCLVSTWTEFIASRGTINLASKMRSADLGAEGPVATVRDLINYPFLDHIWGKCARRAREFILASLTNRQ
jgi:hypothetical protein